jgi:hypothetical protein
MLKRLPILVVAEDPSVFLLLPASLFAAASQKQSHSLRCLRWLDPVLFAIDLVVIRMPSEADSNSAPAEEIVCGGLSANSRSRSMSTDQSMIGSCGPLPTSCHTTPAS